MSSVSSKRVHFSAQNTSGPLVLNPVGKNKVAVKKKRKAWDATVSDLSVHKLTEEQQEKRHRSHQSKNAELAKHELYDKAKEKFDLDSSGNLRPSPIATRGGGLMRSLKGKNLHEVLAESDRALRVVKDMFGDDPMRYSCQPNVTVAPHIVKSKANLERTLLESKRDGPPPTALASPGGIRDESLLELAPRKPALNELPNPQDCDESEAGDNSLDSTLTPHTTTPQGRGYKPSLDLKRFQALIAREENRENIPPTHTQSTSEPLPPPGKSTEMVESGENGKTQSAITKQIDSKTRSDAVTMPMLTVHVPSGGGNVDTESLSGLSDISSIPGPRLKGGDDITEESDTSVALGKGTELLRPGLTEHPLHVAHKMTPTKREETANVVHGELEDLEKIVHSLNKELQEYERTTSLTTSPSTTTVTTPQPPHPIHGTLTNITSTLLTSVTKITHYLHESEAQLRGEAEVRGHLLQTMSEQQNLMDALTSDVVKLQKENVHVKKELKEAQHKTSEQLLSMQKEISDLHKKLSTLALQSIQPTPHSIPSSYQTSSLARMGLADQGEPRPTSKPWCTGTGTVDSTGVHVSPTSSKKSVPLHSKSPPPSVTTISASTSQPPQHNSTVNCTSQPPQHNSTVNSTTRPLANPPAIFTAPSLHQVSSSEHVAGGLSVPYIQAQQSPLSYADSTSMLGASATLSPTMEGEDKPSSLKKDTCKNSLLSEFIPHPSPPPQGVEEFRMGGHFYKDTPTFDDSFAPPPPPLSVALQVPPPSAGLTAPTRGITGEKTNNGALSFDVTGFLSSLGKLSTTAKAEAKGTRSPPVSLVTTSNSTIAPTKNSKSAVDLNPSGPHVSMPPSTTTTRQSHTLAPSKPVTSQPSMGQGLEAPNLSVSLFSIGTEAPDQSHDTRKGSECLELARTSKHSSIDSKLVAGHSSVETKPTSGWFALTSHISHQ